MQKKSGHILVVDDEPAIRELLQEILEEEGYTVTLAADGQSARHARLKERHHLILLDIWMPDLDGISLLKEWKNQQDATPVIMISGHGTIETAVEATRLGAYDFIEKPLSMAKLLLTVRNALAHASLFQENQQLKKKVPPLSEPIGHSLVMQNLREQAWKIAQHNSWVLLQGEFGSGKEIFARYIHQRSPRKQHAFVSMEVQNLSLEQAAVHLFGLEQEGGIQYGLLDQAQGGVLYINEVLHLDPIIQEQLYFALEKQTFYRVNGKEEHAIDVRVIASSQYDLAQAVDNGMLRPELYHHLNVVSLHIPPLRQHPDDIHELLKYYVNWYVQHDRLPYREFSVGAQNRLRNYPWPGNLKELSNIVQRLLILGSDEIITADEVGMILEKNSLPAAENLATLYIQMPLREAREQFEKAYLEQQLRQNGNNISELARKVGLERTHLYRKLRALGIDPKHIEKQER
jgi:DNA-binding NtrC family response regulator